MAETGEQALRMERDILRRPQLGSRGRADRSPTGYGFMKAYRAEFRSPSFAGVYKGKSPDTRPHRGQVLRCFLHLLPSRGFAGSLSGGPGLEDVVGRPPFLAAAAVGAALVAGLKIHV